MLQGYSTRGFDPKLKVYSFFFIYLRNLFVSSFLGCCCCFLFQATGVSVLKESVISEGKVEAFR